MNNLHQTVNLLHEVGMLAHIPRSGFAFLGSGKQSVAEHSFRVAAVAYVLAKMFAEEIDYYKLTMLCLFHDLPEARVGDLNYVQKRYLEANMDKVLNDIEKGSPHGKEIVGWINEYESGEGIEVKIAHDADQLELLLVLKREQELGNDKTQDWYDNIFKRLETKQGKQLAAKIWDTSSDAWWKEIHP